MADPTSSTTLRDGDWWLTFVQVGGFQSAWKRLGLGDEELRELELAILEDPQCGPVVAGTAGLRKIRFSPRAWRTGKSGAIRVYYALFERFGTVFLIFVHDKQYAQTLPTSEKSVIKAWIERTDRAMRQSETRNRRT